MPWSPAGDVHKHLVCRVAQALAVDTGQVIHIGVEAYLNDDSADHLLVTDLGPCGDLTCDRHRVIFCRSLASNFAIGVSNSVRVQHSNGDMVAELVPVALIHRSNASEENKTTRSVKPPHRAAHGK